MRKLTPEQKAERCGVYGLYSLAKKRIIYVGSSRNMPQRKRQHKFMLKTKTHNSSLIQQHVSLFGLDDLVFQIIDSSVDPSRLLSTEQENIQKFETTKDLGGYNSNPDPFKGFRPVGLVPWNKGEKLTEDQKLKVSSGTKLAMSKPEVKHKMSIAKLGKPTGRKGIKTGRIPTNRIDVYAYDSFRKFIGQYPSAFEAGRVLGLGNKGISKVISGERKHYKGYFFSKTPL